MPHRVLSINPGASSTKVAIYEDENPEVVEVIRHPASEISAFKKTLDQLEYRKKIVLDFLARNKTKLEHLSAVVGRGGAFKRLAGGTYQVNQRMLSDIKEGKIQADHVSNLGALIAYELTKGTGVPAFIVDPVSVDEFPEIARISGLPELERKSLSHALNIRMVGHKAARALGKRYEELKLIIVHLGSGISVTAHERGKMIDVNNANDGGPFSPQRTGSLPVTGLAKLCFSGKYNYPEMYEMLTKRGGLLAYLGTDDVREVEGRIKDGDPKAELIYKAMAYQIAKEIGAMATVLSGKVDSIVLTGGIAHSEKLLGLIEERVKFIAQVLVFPGEDEMEALNLGALRVLNKEEEAKEY